MSGYNTSHQEWEYEQNGRMKRLRRRRLKMIGLTVLLSVSAVIAATFIPSWLESFGALP